jgi:hypothetical protein
VKYKVLKSVAHNFSHSFVSSMNYVDDGFVIDDLGELVRNNEQNRISIVWIPDRRQPAALTPRTLKSIAYWKASLPSLVKASGSDIAAISAFTTEIFLEVNKQIAVEGRLIDDRGRVYVSRIYDF